MNWRVVKFHDVKIYVVKCYDVKFYDVKFYGVKFYDVKFYDVEFYVRSRIREAASGRGSGVAGAPPDLSSSSSVFSNSSLIIFL